MDKVDDPRVKSNRYKNEGIAKFEKETFDFQFTQFLIDDNYIGDPPHVQISIDNLNDNINEKFLAAELIKLGNIRTLEIVRHPITRQHLGLAKVQFEDVSVAQACVDNFHGKQLMGRQLEVFKDLRFAIIERLKEVKLAPKQTPQNNLQKPHQQPIVSSSSSLTPQLQTSSSLASTPTSLNNASLHHSHLIHPHQTPLLPLHHSHLQKVNSTGPIPSPLSLDYPITTPGSLTSSGATPESSSNRQRLEDRIAILMKQPNCVLSTIVAPSAPQVSPTYSAFSLNETNYDYANSSYYHYSNQTSAPLKTLDKQRSDSNDIRRSDNNHSNHYQNHKEPYHKYEKANNKQDKHNNLDDNWDEPSPERVKKPLEIELTEKQILDEVLPFCYKDFYKELSLNLLSTIFKKLREAHGYQCLEKAQNAYKAKQDKLKVQRDKERIQNELQKQFERRYMSKARIERPTEAPRPRVNLIRQRTSDYGSMQDTRRRGDADLRRVNRSSAYVAEPERRGSHNTSIDSEYSDSESSSSSSSSLSSRSSSSSSSSSSSGSYSRSSSSCRSSSSSSSSSSSRSSSRSVSPYSRSSRDSLRRSRDRSRKNDSKFRMELSEKSRLTTGSRTDSRAEVLSGSNSETKMDEQIAVDALLCMASKASDNKSSQGYNDSNNLKNFEDEPNEVVKPAPKQVGRKRKKKANEVVGVASEYRAVKRFASDTSNNQRPYDENIENAMVDDENLFVDKREAKFIFPARSADEKARMLDDLFGTLHEEDLKYLLQVHQTEGYKKNHDVEIPFGSDSANKAHLNVRKHMIEGKAAEGHPKWWRGCSRCDVIEISEKEKVDDEEINYEDLTRAPIKSHVIQAANSSRRDQRGDQRRFMALNPDVDSEYMKFFTTNTLQMRAKNLRFSRSKIHKWGLFACEKISNGDAVIEYVGEKIRPSLADHREKIVYTNSPTHDGSSYFFRVDFDVIDATLKGNKARFINHSCNPNCIAKVIKHENGTNSIVIYAKQHIQEDEEITYDYKFPREETDQKICCNCRAPNCQKFLN